MSCCLLRHNYLSGKISTWFSTPWVILWSKHHSDEKDPTSIFSSDAGKMASPSTRSQTVTFVAKLMIVMKSLSIYCFFSQWVSGQWWFYDKDHDNDNGDDDDDDIGECLPWSHLSKYLDHRFNCLLHFPIPHAGGDNHDLSVPFKMIYTISPSITLLSSTVSLPIRFKGFWSCLSWTM